MFGMESALYKFQLLFFIIIKKDLAPRILLNQLGPIQPKVIEQVQRLQMMTAQTLTPVSVCVAL